MTDAAFQVLKTIGVPSIIKGDSSIEVTPAYLTAASLNKISLLYLETLEKSGRIDPTETELSQLRHARSKILDLTVFLGRLFEEQKIPYVIIKTLKPFSYAGSDVDVLISSPIAFSAAVKALQKHNFLLLGHDLFSVTMFRQDFGANVDLQLEISVSGLPYLNKQAISANLSTCAIDDFNVNTLPDFSEAVLTACHAFYKEHMYTIADFYSIALLATKSNSEKLCTLAQQTNSITAVSALLAWVQKITRATFGVNLPGLEASIDTLGHHTLTSILVDRHLEFPLKFPKSFVLLNLANKVFEDKYMRSSLPRGVFASISRRQFRALISHFNQSSY